MEQVYGFCSNKCKIPAVNAGHIVHLSVDINTPLTNGMQYIATWPIGNDHNVNNLMLLGASIKTGSKFKDINNGGADTDFQRIVPLDGGTLVLDEFTNCTFDVKWCFNPATNQIMLNLLCNLSDGSASVTLTGRVDVIFWEY